MIDDTTTSDDTALADLYVAHSRDPFLRGILADYVAVHGALRTLSATLRGKGEGRWSEGIDARARDIETQAQRHVTDILTRGTR